MHLMYFTEQPMSAYPADIGLEFGATALMFSNKYFDPVAGSRLYNEYLEQYIYAEEMGVDGFMLNEHHNAPFCMQAKANIFAAILAAVTKKAKIVMLGNPLPLAENPVRLAEELAMIDMISKGRLVSGFVRGGGQEQLANGVSPAYNRERFEEAHDLVVAAWTRARAVPLGRHALPAPRRQSVGGAVAKAVSAGVDPGRASARRRSSGRRSSAIPISRSTPRSRRPRRSGRSTTKSRAKSATTRGPRTAAICSRSTSPDSEEKAREERPPVPVDAGRIHRPCASGMVEPGGLFLARVSARSLSSSRSGGSKSPRGRPDLRETGR